MKSPKMRTKHNLPRVGSVLLPNEAYASWKMCMVLEIYYLTEVEKDALNFAQDRDMIYVEMLTVVNDEGGCGVHKGYIWPEECAKRFKVLIP